MPPNKKEFGIAHLLLIIVILLIVTIGAVAFLLTPKTPPEDSDISAEQEQHEDFLKLISLFNDDLEKVGKVRRMERQKKKSYVETSDGVQEVDIEPHNFDTFSLEFENFGIVAESNKLKIYGYEEKTYIDFTHPKDLSGDESRIRLTKVNDKYAFVGFSKGDIRETDQVYLFDVDKKEFKRLNFLEKSCGIYCSVTPLTAIKTREDDILYSIGGGDGCGGWGSIKIFHMDTNTISDILDYSLGCADEHNSFIGFYNGKMIMAERERHNKKNIPTEELVIKRIYLKDPYTLEEKTLLEYDILGTAPYYVVFYEVTNVLTGINYNPLSDEIDGEPEYQAAYFHYEFVNETPVKITDERNILLNEENEKEHKFLKSEDVIDVPKEPLKVKLRAISIFLEDSRGEEFFVVSMDTPYGEGLQVGLNELCQGGYKTAPRDALIKDNMLYFSIKCVKMREPGMGIQGSGYENFLGMVDLETEDLYVTPSIIKAR